MRWGVDLAWSRLPGFKFYFCYSPFIHLQNGIRVLTHRIFFFWAKYNTSCIFYRVHWSGNDVCTRILESRLYLKNMTLGIIILSDLTNSKCGINLNNSLTKKEIHQNDFERERTWAYRQWLWLHRGWVLWKVNQTCMWPRLPESSQLNPALPLGTW